MPEPTIFEMSAPGRIGFRFPEPDVPLSPLPSNLVRGDLPFPELAEIDVVRHFTNLSRQNYCIDTGLYPLGSCTMKYNPRINEEVARLPGFAHTHPLQPIDTIQGNLFIMFYLQEWLKEISGFAGVSLQPAAGAQGEFVGVKIIRAYHHERGDLKRVQILIPDSAHGTNPASSSMNNFEIVPISTDTRGNINLDSLTAACNNQTAGLMLTNPNTLGLFEEHILEVTDIVHKAGGLVYGDGANMNALLGIAKPAHLGIDVMHFNLHKTFSTPHGGGGPGSGPVGVMENLMDFLPSPIVVITEKGVSDIPSFYDYYSPPKSIGRVKAFHGQFGMMLRAFTYIAMHGGEGLRKVSEYAVLNANYVLNRLKNTYKVPYNRICMHEFVMEGVWEDAPGIRALDISKRLIDYNFHPPTNYFPLIVHEALMIEPTETESKSTLDNFIDTLITIAEEAHTHPELLISSPHHTPVNRLDEVKAARDLVLCCQILNE